MEYDEEFLTLTQGIENFIIKNEFTFAKNFYPGMYIKDKGKFYRCIINYYGNSLIVDDKQIGDRLYKFLFLLKSFLTQEKKGIDMKVKAFWLENMKKLIDVDQKTKIILNEIDTIVEADFLRSPDKFHTLNHTDLNYSPERKEESFKENYLTSKEENSQSNNNNSPNNSTYGSNSYSSKRHRISLTPNGASKISFFNNNAGGKILQHRTSRVSKKMQSQLYGTNNITTSNTASSFFPIQKSNDSKPIVLKPKADILQIKTCPEKEADLLKIFEGSTQVSTFKLEDEIKQSNLEHINDIIKGSCNKIEPEVTISASGLNEEFILEKEIEGLNLIKKKEEIQYASLNLLLKQIAVENLSQTNQPLILSFLQQYSSFISTEVLLQKVLNMYKILSKDKKFYPGLVRFMNMWIVLKYEDEIFNQKKLSESFEEFYMQISVHPDILDHFEAHQIRSIQEIFKIDSNYDIEYSINRMKGRKKSQNISFKSESLIPESISDIFDVLEWSEVEIARQLTLISHQLFSKIEYKELFSAVWTKKNKYVAAPNVMKIIDRFNKMSLWIIEEILSYDKKRMRAGTVEKFIKIAEECKKLCNFNDCVNIVSCMNNFIVKNLKKTWKVMNREVFPVLENLNTFCSYDNNYSNMREEMKNCKGRPCVPYLGMLLKELAFIEEGPKYVKDSNLINIEKIKNVAGAINGFFSYKAQAYLFRPIEELAILAEFHPKTEEEIETLADKMGIIVF